MQQLPAQAQVAIVGGGIVGCSLAYHIAKRGVRDVVLLERRQLTCGTTWHAAGLVGQLRATHNLTRLARYTADLYARLEAETGRATGFRQIGSLSVAATPERFEELRRGASMARCFELEVAELGPAEIKAKWPLIDIEGLVGGVYLPKDGQTNPIDTTLALAKGAKDAGVQIFENTKVNEIIVANGRARGVRTEHGDVAADVVVNCAGMWARDLGTAAGATVPLHAAEHFYIVTEPLAGASADLPVLRDPDARAYFKADAGKLLVGWFEAVAKPWGVDGIPESFCFDQLPDDLGHIEPLLAGAIKRVPALSDVGIQLFFNGPESFTPDNRYLLGETPEVRGLFVATGFNSIGIQSAGGAGKVLADWIVDGHPPFDLWDVDVRRMMPFQRNRQYLKARTKEVLGLLYDMHWPFRQPASARGVRKSVLHDRLRAQGACFGETAGWERANWFAPPGVTPEYEYAYGRQNWFEHSAAEHRATREAVALFDQSSFGKFIVEGTDAEAVLNRICANDVAAPVGAVIYTQWLNERGGIEADVTITRESETRFLVVTSSACQIRDLTWLRQHIPESARAAVFDATSAFAVLGIMGPRSRELLSRLTPTNLANDAFPFATSQQIEVGHGLVRASRITYVGELGWELYIPTEFAQSVYDAIAERGADYSLRHAGYHAMNSLRMEKGYRHWGHDITDEDNPLEAGLGFAVKLAKPHGFIGREAVARRKEEGIRRRLVQFKLTEGELLAYHNEPIWRDGRLVGRTCSGMFGHTIGAPLTMGYIGNDGQVVDAGYVNSGTYHIEVGGEKVRAEASLLPWYDPKSARVKET